MTNYTSSKEIIAQLLVDFNIPKTDYEDRIYAWIANGLEIMELEKYYVYKHELIKAKEYKATLPCCVKFLHSLWVYGGRGCNCRNDRNLQLLTIRNNPLIGKLIKDEFHESFFATIDGNFLHTSFREGDIVVFYKGVPVDEEGFPLVPDDAKLKEALPYYLIYRMGLSGYEHPIIKWNDAYTMWNNLYPAAANSINWMDLTEYQEFTEMWNNMIIGDLANNLYLH